MSNSAPRKRGPNPRQRNFLNALSENGGKISGAAKEAGISRQTHHNWCRSSMVYRECFESVIAGISEKKKRGPGGRPTKYSSAVQEKICSAISQGLPLTHAAAIGGISYQTLSEWRSQFPLFSDAIERAKAEGIQARLKLILSSAERGDVSSARWWLEHVVPEHFAKNRVDHQHSIEGSIRHSFAVPHEVLNAIAEARKRHDDD